MAKAILVVSFGTTHLDTLGTSIEATEEHIASVFPEYKLYRAFTSNIIRKRLMENEHIQVDSVSEALQRIHADGIRDVVVQPTLLIPGEEFDKVCALVQEAKGNLHISMGKPLFDTHEDLDKVISLLQQVYPTAPDTVLLMMGHGTAHAANDFYISLNEKMRKVTSCHMRLCTVEGTPDFRDGVEEVKTLPVKKVVVAPLMLVAGDHAKNDMASTEPDSLRSLLEQAGLTVSYRIQGLGQFSQIRDLYVDRIRQAKPL